MSNIEVLLLDIGGVLLTNGWDTSLRKKAADHFQFDFEEVNKRHGLMFNTFEIGKLSLDEYLRYTIFFEKRQFSLSEVKQFILEGATAHQETIDFFKTVKLQYGLRVGTLSNEGRELAIDRINRFSLSSLCDFFVISSFVGYTKPNPDIYHLAINISGVDASRILYLDDRLLLTEMGRSLGLNALHHQNVSSTQATLEKYGLKTDRFS